MVEIRHSQKPKIFKSDFVPIRMWAAFFLSLSLASAFNGFAFHESTPTPFDDWVSFKKRSAHTGNNKSRNI